MIYFTSDLHFGHEAIIHMCKRPFCHAEEMNHILISNWNKTVSEQDTVYILGDIAHRIPVETANFIIAQLKGRKILIKGNHDKMYHEQLFKEICDYKEINVDGVSISLMHYPMLEWRDSRRGSLHLHGHQHNTAEYNLKMKKEGILRFDVGVDANEFKPVPLPFILDFFEIKHS